jgi:hypothetical protein
MPGKRKRPFEGATQELLAADNILYFRGIAFHGCTRFTQIYCVLLAALRRWSVSLGNLGKIKSGRANTKGSATLKVWTAIDRALGLARVVTSFKPLLPKLFLAQPQSQLAASLCGSRYQASTGDIVSGDVAMVSTFRL